MPEKIAPKAATDALNLRVTALEASTGSTDQTGILTPEQYGATGTGDDSNAFQDMFAAMRSTGAPMALLRGQDYEASVELTDVRGLTVVGAGRYYCKWRGTGGAPALLMDGAWYNRFQGIYFTTGAAIAAAGVIELDKRSGTFGVQGNLFDSCYFDGSGLSDYAFTMCRVGQSAAQGSENTFNSCHFQSPVLDGYYQLGFNALQNTFLDCNFQAFPRNGIIAVGSLQLLSCAFQCAQENLYTQILNNGWDVNVANGGVYDRILVHGCRTESLRFLTAGFAQIASINSLTHEPSIPTWDGNPKLLNAVCYATTAAGNVKMYKVVTAGNPGGSPPVWPETGTVADGSVVWQQEQFAVVQFFQGGLCEHSNIKLGQIAGSDISEFRHVRFSRNDPIMGGSTYLVVDSNPQMDNCYRQITNETPVPLELGNALSHAGRLMRNIGSSALGSIVGTGGGTANPLLLYREGVNRGTPILNWWRFLGGVGLPRMPFSGIPGITTYGTTANGMLPGVMVFCEDGMAGTGGALVGGGTGCVAVFQNGGWKAIS